MGRKGVLDSASLQPKTKRAKVDKFHAPLVVKPVPGIFKFLIFDLKVPPGYDVRFLDCFMTAPGTP